MSPRLHVLDRVCEGRCPHVGTLVRYADHFVVMCDTKAHVEECRQRVGTVLTRLRLELHPEKTRTVDLSRGCEGFVSYASHLRKRAGSRLAAGRAAVWTRPFFKAWVPSPARHDSVSGDGACQDLKTTW